MNEYISKKILYIDDDEDDREFLLDAINELDPAIEVVLAENGLKALDYLNTIKDSDIKLPCLIILDINMPYLDGMHTFQRIKNDRKLESVPIVIFTSSENPNDKILFNSLGVELISKPNNISYMANIANYMLTKCA